MKCKLVYDKFVEIMNRHLDNKLMSEHDSNEIKSVDSMNNFLHKNYSNVSFDWFKCSQGEFSSFSNVTNNIIIIDFVFSDTGYTDEYDPEFEYKGSYPDTAFVYKKLMVDEFVDKHNGESAVPYFVFNYDSMTLNEFKKFIMLLMTFNDIYNQLHKDVIQEFHEWQQENGLPLIKHDE